jgi:hypothetical protein
MKYIALAVSIEKKQFVPSNKSELALEASSFPPLYFLPMVRTHVGGPRIHDLKRIFG